MSKDKKANQDGEIEIKDEEKKEKRKQELLRKVKQDGHALRFASAKLREDREFVLAAVKQNA